MATVQQEMIRTTEVLIDIVEKGSDNPKQVVADILFQLRATNRTSDKALKFMVEYLDSGS